MYSKNEIKIGCLITMIGNRGVVMGRVKKLNKDGTFVVITREGFPEQRTYKDVTLGEIRKIIRK